MTAASHGSAACPDDCWPTRAPHGNPVLGICLGFQLLSSSLGLTVSRGEQPRQGTQRTIDVFGSPATVGFYNSFSVRAGGRPGRGPAPGRGGTRRRPGTDEVIALRGPGVAGVHFHPESVLSRSGAELFLGLMRDASREGAVLATTGALRRPPRTGWPPHPSTSRLRLHHFHPETK